MGKRSMGFTRRERDYYPTPYGAVLPLHDHITSGATFDEPCAGDGQLIAHLRKQDFTCRWASDIQPQRPVKESSLTKVIKQDVFDVENCNGEVFITNPPWIRTILHPLIVHLSDIAPTWLLFDADWVHTKQSVPYINRLRKIIAVGRVKWIEGSKHTGKDNVAWHLFDKPSSRKTQFFGRT